MLLKQSKIRHISYLELDGMLRDLAERVRGSVKGIKPQTSRDYIPAALLANFLNVPLGQGTEFSIYSDATTEICLFKKEYESEHYNRTVKHYIDIVQVEVDGNYQKITFEWEK